MALLLGTFMPSEPQVQIIGVAVVLSILIAAVFVLALRSSKDTFNGFTSFCTFFYVSFLKPHCGDNSGNGQQDALESFYKAQAGVYDATRTRLLRGREDMLVLVAAQLQHRMRSKGLAPTKPIWVDIGGGTGYNIEKMSASLDVPEFFSSVYLVDLSPSLCEVARQRFARLGWNNVKVVCQDARSFRLEDHEPSYLGAPAIDRRSYTPYLSDTYRAHGAADLITLSYSLSMIPDFYSVIDSLASLLPPNGIVGVADFYVQSIFEGAATRNYTGGVLNRHVNWLGRVFWRAWFEVDRVGLESSRRDYLEYRLGTIVSADARNYMLGGIPYYIWIGTHKSYPHETLERLDAAVTESPYLSAMNHRQNLTRNVEQSVPQEIRSKSFQAAIINLAGDLPLPSAYYQNHHWRIHYDDQLRKHTQFNNSYIYAFTWEDARVDQRLLKIKEDDVILAITSAGDNILAYALQNPRRIHAVDLNPSQNHLLELKIAAFTALDYADVWKLFGDGRHEKFRDLLVSRLSPHLSSRAFQYWLDKAATFTSQNGHGLYETGGSRHAIRGVRYLFRILGLRSNIQALCKAKTLNEQREIWRLGIRGVLLSRILSWTVIGNENFLWKALGVPPAQRNMIQADFLEHDDLSGTGAVRSDMKGQAIWEYVVNTLDPVVENTLICEDNYFYLLCLQGKYSRKCHPAYLTPKAHVKLSRPGAFDGLRIHTDEINEVVSRITPGTLTIAVVMDSMDWFTPGKPEAAQQIATLNHALRLGGRVLLRSAGLKPWYVSQFEQLGFAARRVGVRVPGSCIDR
ncbi:MAG: hypothetical protein M1827_005908 [Pycnora praestabilis]|nr:MAG: hypothetical protein M1827_005908 [Pycnora praestabilis]